MFVALPRLRALRARGHRSSSRGSRAERIDRPSAVHAARILVALVEGGAVRALDGARRLARSHARRRRPDARVARARSCGSTACRAAAASTPTHPGGRADRADPASRDLDVLVAWCSRPRRAVVAGGRARAARCSASAASCDSRRCSRELDDAAGADADRSRASAVGQPGRDRRARALAARRDRRRQWQFHLCLGLGDRRRRARRRPRTGRRAVVPPRRLGRADRDASSRGAARSRSPTSPHHHAYQRVGRHAARRPESAARSAHALLRFLEVERRDRPLHLRASVARRLAARVRATRPGLPLLVERVRRRASSTDVELGVLDALPRRRAALARGARRRCARSAATARAPRSGCGSARPSSRAALLDRRGARAALRAHARRGVDVRSRAARAAATRRRRARSRDASARRSPRCSRGASAAASSSPAACSAST